MNRLLLSAIILIVTFFCARSADLSSLSWSQVCSGSMGAEWYGSPESMAIADIVMDVQKTNGGWMKNDELHKLSSSELEALKNSRHERSCLDNYATVQEMRFLAKVYQGCKVQKYRNAFSKALEMIFESEKDCGGWSQYWPLSGNGSYQDYITFNDDLMTNVMKILRDISDNTGDFKEIVDEATRQRCLSAFDRGIDVILKCQIDDNGIKAAWCAQHDPSDFLPTEGRPHELPSVSGSESAALLSFLMTVKNPSVELQEAIISAVAWLDSHKIDGKAIEDYINESGEKDRRIVDKVGSAVWGRFIQLGGNKGKEVYDKLFNKLLDRGKNRSYTWQGKTYTYSEYELASVSYREENAYQPIYAIYSDEYQHLYYRFLYNYADSDPVVDDKGLPVATSLMADNRRSYQYLGSWCQKVIEVEYPAWKQKIDALNQAGDAVIYELSSDTYEEGAMTYLFGGGFTISNTSGKQYSTGKTGTIKYSAGVEYLIGIPNGLSVVKISFYGYDNYDVDAYLQKLNGVSYGSDDYVFPAKVDGDMRYVNHTVDLSQNPVSGTLDFSLGAKQCCLVISLYCKAPTGGLEEIKVFDQDRVVKSLKDGRIVIEKNGKLYDTSGLHVKNR